MMYSFKLVFIKYVVYRPGSGNIDSFLIVSTVENLELVKSRLSYLNAIVPPNDI